MGWYIGFKLHLLCNEKCEIIDFTLTRACVDNRDVDVMNALTDKAFGKLYADKGYIFQTLFGRLWDKGVHIITGLRSNMKQKLMQNMADIDWRIAIPENIEKDSGIYFLRTNVATFDEKTTWDYYNLTREIECTNRQLKIDLNLRPIHHQIDGKSDAHLFFGLLAYWVVNTIRYRLKQSGIKHYWTEIVRIMSTQKAITTEATNALGEIVYLRQCSEPTKTVEDIYERLKYKKMPFRKIRIDKICST